MAAGVDLDKRRFLTGHFASRTKAVQVAPSGPPPAMHHISSAVVTAFPERCAELVPLINALPDTEVHHVGNGKIVVVLEGADSGIIGGRLAAIALMEGVLSANMVFEQVETLDDLGAAP